MVSAYGALLERAEELTRIEAALEHARAGRDTFVLVEGPAGTGKTALVAAARTTAANEGMRVLRARGAELERDFAFGVVRQLFEPVLADASDFERADLMQGAAGVAAGLLVLPDAPATKDDAASPLCLVVDDAHYARRCVVAIPRVPADTP